MRILITGGSGFIGGRLADHFLKSNHYVRIAVRNSEGSIAQLSEAEIEKIIWEDDRSLECICSGIDLIIHAAGMNAQDCNANPEEALKFNGFATARLVKAAGRVGVKKFLYLSTAHVYARPLVGVITEETMPSNCHPYATSHLVGEKAVLMAANQGGMEGAVLRLSNTFGVPIDVDKNCWMLLVNDLCKQAVQTGNLVLQSNSFEQRDFICLTQVCRVIEQLVITDGLFKQVGVLNVGRGVSHSLLSMAQLIQKRCIEVLDFRPKIKNEKYSKDDRNFILTYNINKLNALGVKCTNSESENIAELDRLLNFCRLSFSVK